MLAASARGRWGAGSCVSKRQYVGLTDYRYHFTMSSLYVRYMTLEQDLESGTRIITSLQASTESPVHKLQVACRVTVYNRSMDNDW